MKHFANRRAKINIIVSQNNKTLMHTWLMLLEDSQLQPVKVMLNICKNVWVVVTALAEDVKAAVAILNGVDSSCRRTVITHWEFQWNVFSSSWDVLLMLQTHTETSKNTKVSLCLLSTRCHCQDFIPCYPTHAQLEKLSLLCEASSEVWANSHNIKTTDRWITLIILLQRSTSLLAFMWVLLWQVLPT